MSARAARARARGAADTAPPAPKAWLPLAVLGVAALVLGAHAVVKSGYYADAAFVSLRYAERFAQGAGLTWNDGERVEGYANLLWVLLTSVLGGAGVPWVLAPRALGFLSGLALAGAIVAAHPPRSRASAIPALFGALVVALSGPVAVWVVGGLESVSVAALLAWAVVLSRRRLGREPAGLAGWIAPGLLLALLAISRPEGVAFALAAAIAWTFSGGSRAGAWRLLALPLAAVVAHTGFRLAYYGDALPASVRTQLGFGTERLLDGAFYVLDGLLGLVPVLAVVAMGFWWARGRAPAAGDGAAPPGRAWRFTAIVAAGWLACVVLIGGDLLPARRFLLPALGLLALLGADALAAARAAGTTPRALATVAGIALLVYAPLNLLDPAVRRTQLEGWVWDGQVVGAFLGTAFGGVQPLLAVDPAGSVPFYSKLPAIDMRGVNDRWISTHPPARDGGGAAARDLGDGDYVLSREPDLVMMCQPAGSDTGCWRSGRELIENPAFIDRYIVLQYEAKEPHEVRARLWTRREGGKLGIQRTENRVIVPGWQLNADIASTTRIDDRGNVGVTVWANRITGIAALALEPGRWRVLTDSDQKGIRVWVRDYETGELLGQTLDGAYFDHRGGRVDVAVQSNDQTARLLRRLVFDRRPPGSPEPPAPEPAPRATAAPPARGERPSPSAPPPPASEPPAPPSSDTIPEDAPSDTTP